MFKRTWIDETVTINASATQLHALLKDFDGWPRWTRGLRAIKRRDQSPLQIGTRFTMVLDPGIPLDCKIFAYDHQRLEWGGGVGSSVVRHSFEIKQLTSATCELRHTEYATGALAVLAFPLERSIHAYDHRWTNTIVSQFASR